MNENDPTTVGEVEPVDILDEDEIPDAPEDGQP